MANDTKQKLARMVAGRLATMTPKPLDASRSTTGQIKGFLTRDTLHRLQEIVAYHQKAPRANAEDRLALILGLCDTYLTKHGGDTDPRAKAKLASVEDIKAEAQMERDRWAAEAQYLSDARAVGDTNVKTRFLHIKDAQSVGKAIPQARALAKGERDPGNREFGFTQATLDLIKKYGLTEAEVLAVKLYTSDDYQYINPGNANSESYMKYENFAGARWVKWQPEGTPEPREDELDEDDYLPAAKAYLASPEGQKHVKELFQEGSLHGAMALSALRKLPRMQGTCYRGSRLTEADYQSQYVTPAPDWPAKRLTNLYSVATEESPAIGFATKVSRRRATTVSIITELAVEDGRDVGDLSLVGRLEKEWLLLPGARLQIASVEEVTDEGRKWDATAKCIYVKAYQVS